MSMKRKGATCCAPLLRARLGRDDAEALATAFKAIADPGRLRLLNFIAGQRGAEACVCHLVEPLGLAQPTVSHHLRVLTEASGSSPPRDGSAARPRRAPAIPTAERGPLASRARV